MDERPDQLSSRQDTPEEGVRRKLSGERGEIDPTPSAASDELEEIRLELARTRAQMSETVDTLQGRLNPQYVREQASSQAKDTAKQAGSNVIETIKDNPIPTALTGTGLVGLGWLVVNVSKGSSGSSSQQSFTQQSVSDGPRYYGSTERRYPASYESQESEGRESEASSQGAGGQARERASQMGSQLQDRASQAGGQAQEKASQAGQQAQEQAQRAKGGFQKILQESPLALGALAAGIGAAVALAVPGTGKEDEVMGETRDNLVESGKQSVRETRERAQRVIEEGRSSAEQEAQRQDLT